MATINYPSQILEPIRKYLADRLSVLESRKKQVAKADPFSDPARVNENAAADDDAAEQFGHLQASALKQSYDKMIIQIRKALSMIKIGKYGVCEHCGQMIDTDRLMVMPEATVCIKCEKRREK